MYGWIFPDAALIKLIFAGSFNLLHTSHCGFIPSSQPFIGGQWRTLMAEDPWGKLQKRMASTTWWRSRYFPSENHVCYQAEVHAWPLFDQSQLTTPVTPAPVQLDRAHIEFSRHFKGVCLDCEVTKTSEHHANELEQMMWGVPSFRYKLKKRANLGALEVWNKHMAFRFQSQVPKVAIVYHPRNGSSGWWMWGR